MNVFDSLDIEAVKAEEGASEVNVRWLITRDMGAENFAMRLFEIAVGGYTPFHSHPWEHEVYVLQGQGLVFGDGKEFAFKLGTVVFVPANEKHQFRNSGLETLKFLCMIPYKKG